MPTASVAMSTLKPDPGVLNRRAWSRRVSAVQVLCDRAGKKCYHNVWGRSVKIRLGGHNAIHPPPYAM